MLFTIQTTMFLDNKQTNTKQNLKGDWLLLFLTADKFRIYRHITAIFLLFLMFLGGKIKGEFSGIVDTLEWIVSWLVILVLLYLNLYVLVPKILYKGRSVRYLLSLGGSILLGGLFLTCLTYFVWEKYRVIPLENNNMLFLRYYVLTLFLIPFILSSTLIKFFQIWIKDTIRIQSLEKQAVESELQALRSQIHPHFLFNMLNSINVLTRRDPEKASYIIVKLSDFLRHLIYETHHETVYLLSEIRFLNDYLSLEKMRRDDFLYEINFEETDLQGVKIPPNILLMLVENAVKHSADAVNESYVYLNFYIQEGYLFFVGRNSITSHTGNAKKASGIGLPNIQRRLELIYGNNFLLFAERIKGEYVVTLKLPL